MPKPLIEKTLITKVHSEFIQTANDFLASEEPLEIRIEFGPLSERQSRSISVTMRTPGNDFELVLGFLFSEGMICSIEDIVSIKHCLQTDELSRENITKVSVKEHVILDFPKLERNFYTTSSCGVCGKSSIQSIKTKAAEKREDTLRIKPELIYDLPEIARKNQTVFELTGGLHASSLFSIEGEFLFLREDIGRHNALDKLIGYAMSRNLLPLNNHVLFLSGRISFELIQKSIMAGIKIIVAAGAPSSLAVELAREFDITLIGFLKSDRFNVYSGEKRVLISENGRKS